MADRLQGMGRVDIFRGQVFTARSSDFADHLKVSVLPVESRFLRLERDLDEAPGTPTRPPVRLREARYPANDPQRASVAVPVGIEYAHTFVNCFTNASEGEQAPLATALIGRRMDDIANFLSGATGRNLDDETGDVIIIFCKIGLLVLLLFNLRPRSLP